MERVGNWDERYEEGLQDEIERKGGDAWELIMVKWGEADVGIDGCGGIKLIVGLRACHSNGCGGT